MNFLRNKNESGSGIWKLVWVNLAVFLALCILIVAGLEIWARVTYSSSKRLGIGVWCFENNLYRQLAQKLPNYKDHYDSLEKATQAGFQYYDYYVYSLAPLKTKTINITDYYSARNVPESVPLGKAKTIIWFFGGSTLANLDSPDDLTIVNQVARELKKEGVQATLLNFSTAAFQSSLEFIKFTDLLRRVPKSELPTMAIFYDGYNDPWYGLFNGAGNMPRTFANVSEIFKEKNHPLMFYSLAYDYVLKHSVYWRMKWHFRVFAAIQKAPPDPSSMTADEYYKTLSGTISAYAKNVVMTDAVCAAGGIKCMHILQPMIFTKKPLHLAEEGLLRQQSSAITLFFEKFYLSVSVALAGKESFVNMADVLNGRGDLDFYDIGHTSPLGTSEVLGKRIAAEIVRKMQ